MIQQILEVDGDVEIVSLLTRSRTATTLWSDARDSRTAAAARRSSYRACTWATRSTRGACATGRRSVAPVDVTESKRAADAKINNEGSGRLAEVARNECLTRQRREIEVSERRAPDVLC